MKKIVLSLSGGLDSSVMLAGIPPSQEVLCVNASYGSRHSHAEQRAARRVADHYARRLITVRMEGAFAPMKSALLAGGGPLPLGHYESESMRQTVVPCRNLVLIGVLAGIADSDGAQEVWIGAHAGDHHIYPDCRPDFLLAVSDGVRLATEGRVNVSAPLLAMDKSGIVSHGLRLKVPFHLTHTCYAGGGVACGKCGSCQERLAAFAKNGVQDSIEYETRDLMTKV